ncbi:MAG: monovalent cation/H(+) antiporter subunit G [candidate division WOR-3 bacterium]|uniref:Na+/H+ antiporter subunit G n=1 Tax=candidate division WOR-3 bacterium TaxID=2052148 RepID=A0A7C1N9Q1_UNCW3|nr:monovalent cation/H(+) antiporter subunit G [candidate division WOR-3 bacterium]
MISVLALIFLWLGVVFVLLGALGLARFPDLYNRMQAATKCVTLGVCGIMIGIFLRSGFNPLGIKALLAAVFILFTVPVSSHALVRGSLIAGVRLWKGTVRDDFTADRGAPSIIDNAGAGEEEK